MSEKTELTYPFTDYSTNPFNIEISSSSKKEKHSNCAPACKIGNNEVPPEATAISESQISSCLSSSSLSSSSLSSSSQKMHRSDMKFSPEEKELYLGLFTNLTKLEERREKVGSIAAAKLMKSSGLPSAILKSIWLTVVRSDSRQEIRKSEFFGCLKLVAIAQRGGPVNKESLVQKLKQGELPVFYKTTEVGFNKSGNKREGEDLVKRATTLSKTSSWVGKENKSNYPSTKEPTENNTKTEENKTNRDFEKVFFLKKNNFFSNPF